MESRTSPGKKGSVQPISVSLMAASRLFLAWEYTRAVLDTTSCVSIAWGGYVPP
jgi:hypothetical protein